MRKSVFLFATLWLYSFVGVASAAEPVSFLMGYTTQPDAKPLSSDAPVIKLIQERDGSITIHTESGSETVKPKLLEDTSAADGSVIFELKPGMKLEISNSSGISSVRLLLGDCETATTMGDAEQASSCKTKSIKLKPHAELVYQEEAVKEEKTERDVRRGRAQGF